MQIQNLNQAVTVLIQVAQKAILKGNVFTNLEEIQLAMDAINFIVPPKPKEEEQQNKTNPLKLAEEK